MSRGIFPPDQRSVIDPGSSLFSLFPFPAVTAVDVLRRIESVSGEVNFIPDFGSGITITPNHVLTAAHVLYGFNSFNPDRDQAVARVSTSEKQQLLVDRRIGVNDVDPAHNVISIHLDDDFLRTSEFDDDIALLRTSTNNRLLDEDEVIGLIAFVNPEDAVGFAAETAGYPIDNVTRPILGNSGMTGRDLTGRDLVVAPTSPFLGNVVSTFSERLYRVDSNIDVFNGQSGSGIWSSYQGDPLRVFGLINFNVISDPSPPDRSGGNGGILITTDLYNEIMAQVEADSGTANANLLPENLIIGSDPGFFSPITGGGNDDILGTYRRERIIGNGGDDNLYGGGGDDRLEGGEGIDQAVFSDEFVNYDWTTPNENNDFVFEFDHNVQGDRGDGRDTAKDIEFGTFEFVDANKDGRDDDGNLFYVPLEVDPDDSDKLKDGEIISPKEKLLNEEGEEIATMTVQSPAWMFDGVVKYNLSIGLDITESYNLAFIVDRSGSMGGGRLTECDRTSRVGKIKTHTFTLIGKLWHSETNINRCDLRSHSLRHRFCSTKL